MMKMVCLLEEVVDVSKPLNEWESAEGPSVRCPDTSGFETSPKPLANPRRNLPDIFGPRDWLLHRAPVSFHNLFQPRAKWQ